MRTLRNAIELGQGPPRLSVRGLARHRQDQHGQAAGLRAQRRGRPAHRLLARRSGVPGDHESAPRSTSSRWTRRPTTRSTTSASCGRTWRWRRWAARAACTSSTRRTCCRTAAWNAFLKTLEEPPAHVVFVLATTEAHKVPPTIVDRCHRFDFQRPSLEQIAGVLSRVAAEEGITIPDAALGMIARKAAGSFRDALGTLEQLVTYGGKEIRLEDVLENLGVARRRADPRRHRGAGARATRGRRCCAVQAARGVRARRDAVHARSGRRTCVTCSWFRRSARCPTRSPSRPSTPDRLAAQAERLSQGEIIRAIELLALRSRPSRRARSRACSWRWRC